MSKAAKESASFWRRESRRLALVVNTARWLEVMLPGALIVTGLFAVSVLIRRRLGVEAFFAEGVILAVVALVGCGWVAWRRMNAMRCTEADALARLDARMHLRNRLTAANEGVGDWPPVMAGVQSGFRWKWSRMVALLSMAALFLVASVWIPIPRQTEKSQAKVAPPAAWGEVETSLEVLKEEELVSPEALAAMEKKLASLTNQKEEEWYRQSSLEASDALRMEAANALKELTQNLEHAQNLLAQQGERLDHHALPFSSEQMAEWSKALENLGSGAFPLHEKQLQALKERAAGMTKEEMQALAEKMSAQREAAKQAMASLGQTMSLMAALDELAKNSTLIEVGLMNCGSGDGREEGGHEPLQVLQNALIQAAGDLENLPKRDSDDLLFGDALMTTEGEHDYDPTAALQRQQGGTISSPGSGGSAVWREELMPSEKAFLQKFFK